MASTKLRDRDALRKGPVRLMGYANEVGEVCLSEPTARTARAKLARAPELSHNGITLHLVRMCSQAFRPLVARWIVGATYGVAGTYVAADAVWRASVPPPGRSGALECVDTFVWQTLASVAIPGAVINRTVWAAGKIPAPRRLGGVLPTAIGLASIPFIVKPIDHGVDTLMERWVRPLYLPPA